METQNLKAQLQACDTVAQMLKVCIDQFDLEIKPGPIVKQTFIAGLLQAMIMLRPQSKKP